MELLLKYLCFLIFLHEVSSEFSDDVIFDMISRRLDHISITLAKIARKQKVLETRLDERTGSGNEKVPGAEGEKLKNKLSAIERAVSTEKQYLRKLIDAVETKIEIMATAHNMTTRGQDSHADKIEPQTIIGDLHSRLALIEKNLGSMETTSNNIVNRIDLMEKKIGSMETYAGDIESRVDSVESGILSLIAAENKKVSKKVSFSAQYRPKQGTAIIFKKERSIPFNYVFYNEGSGFNVTTGIFTVPVSGVYQFIYFVEGLQLNDEFTCPAAVVHIYVDGISAGTAAVADPRHALQHIQAGNAYINYFRKGQEVLVGTANTCEEYTIFAYRTTFSGVLLY